jgi:hypothetical protein
MDMLLLRILKFQPKKLRIRHFLCKQEYLVLLSPDAGHDGLQQEEEIPIGPPDPPPPQDPGGEPPVSITCCPLTVRPWMVSPGYCNIFSFRPT